MYIQKHFLGLADTYLTRLKAKLLSHAENHWLKTGRDFKKPTSSLLPSAKREEAFLFEAHSAITLFLGDSISFWFAFLQSDLHQKNICWQIYILTAFISNQQNYMHKSHSYIVGSILPRGSANLFCKGPSNLCCNADHEISVATA